MTAKEINMFTQYRQKMVTLNGDDFTLQPKTKS